MIFRRMAKPRELASIEARFSEELRETELEKGDKPALLIAAFLVFAPAALLMIALMTIIPLLLFGMI